ncbi:hypothetical protein PO124_14925 [Bacillus licheniformis]|nr:hypothetical protein [Bacillus licheniformis]
MAVIAPVSFIFASYIVYWSGWNTVSWLLGSQLVMFAVYCACKNTFRRTMFRLHSSLNQAGGSSDIM